MFLFCSWFVRSASKFTKAKQFSSFTCAGSTVLENRSFVKTAAKPTSCPKYRIIDTHASAKHDVLRDEKDFKVVKRIKEETMQLFDVTD